MKKFKDSYLFKSFRYKYFAKNFFSIFLVLSIPFTILIIWFYNVSIEQLNSNIKQTNEKLLSTASNTMDNLLSISSNVGYYLSTLPEIEEFCYFGNTNQSTTSNQTIQNAVRFAELSNKTIDSIWIYSYSKDKFFSINTTVSSFAIEQAKIWTNEILELNQDKSTFVYSVKYDIYPEMLSFYIPILSNKKVSGCILVNLNVENITDLLEFAPENTFVLQQNNDILYSNVKNVFSRDISKKAVFEETEEFPIFSSHQSLENSVLYTTHDSIVRNLHYTLQTDMSYYYQQYTTIYIILGVYIFVAFVSSFLLSSWVAVNTSKPIWRMFESLSKKGREDASQSQTNDVVEEIISAIRENDSLNNLLSSKMRLLESSQLIALQTQINPHFLYNTLETVKWSAMELTHSTNKVSKTIQELGKLLRYSLTMTPPFTTLAEEQQNIILYLSIANIRFENKIHMVWHCEQETLERKLPRLLLQPIIENCISHGLRYITEARYIHVFSKMEGECLRLSIWDNGIGICADDLKAINERINTMDIFADRHIGLLNVAQRIKLTYGESSSMYVTSEEDIGTEVVLNLYDTALAPQQTDDHPVFGLPV